MGLGQEDSHVQTRLDHVAPCTKLNLKVNPKWIKDLSTKLEARNDHRKHGGTWHSISIGNDFLKLRAQQHRPSSDLLGNRHTHGTHPYR